ncbi:uncharacterized protein LOC116298634, partial [Actinia tenebrosa]|uniref:Uncharacterized protein LOC116298634 n=1 Tax=Actinia tenebrosa TaxID=6105 RepID=A0A6P8IBT0_ACTTE
MANMASLSSSICGVTSESLDPQKNCFIFCCDDDKKPENEKDKYFVSSTISEVVDMIMDAVGEKKGLRELFLPETYDRLLKSMRVPDWVLLYFKLQTKLPDDAWQTLLNLTHLGRSGNSLDNAVLLTKNQIKAIKKMIFNIIKSTLKITELETDFPSCGVDLNSVLIWAIREQRLYGADTPHMEFNIKIDGRPLGGKDQIAVGIVPIDFAKKSPESALSVYPVAIANCKEERSNMKQLIGMLNKQKNWLKQHGLCVDGKSYNFKFTVTLDYKALLLLIHKKDDESFTLGGKGYGVEFCVFCDAVRACTHHGEIPNHACVDCLRSKANIARPTGVRDDLTFLLEEDLSNINLCSLHCEMRNMEQLLGSLGLFSHRVGTLDQLNNILSQYGPENTRGRTRIQVKEKPGQQTAVGRHNIKVASFSGCTERQFLDNAENI